MNLRDFLLYTYSGAFTVFQTFITSPCLSNRDRKALRLALGQPLTDAILPYMVGRLFLSQHEEDINVLKLVATHPALCKRVTQIFWDSTVPSSIFKTKWDNMVECFPLDDAAITERLNSTIARDVADRYPEDYAQHFREQWALRVQAGEFWRNKLIWWRTVDEQGRDLDAFKNAFLDLTSLRRITVLDEERFPCALHTQYQKCWPSPQVRIWADLPFYHFLKIPRKTHMNVNGSWRIMDLLVHLHSTGMLELGALIVDTYGRGQLKTSLNPRGEDTRFHVHLQPYEDFEAVVNGYGSIVPDIPNSKKLTLRLIKEISGRHQSLWEGDEGRHDILNQYASLWESSLEELTLCRVDLAAMVAHFTAIEDRDDLFNIMTQCKNLRRIRFYGCWCPNPAAVLIWLWQNTRVREVECHFIISGDTWWSVVMAELRAAGVVFDFFELTECIVCEDPLEATTEREDGELWFGKSADVVPWLKGETTEYPLRNVSPGDEGLILDLRSFVASLDGGGGVGGSATAAVAAT